jgi:hypothetical protein
MLEHITDELDRLFQTGQNVIISEEILARATFDIPHSNRLQLRASFDCRCLPPALELATELQESTER